MNVNSKRRDNSGSLLKVGELQRKNGLYQFAWYDEYGKKRYLYAGTLSELREKEAMVNRDKADGIKASGRYTTVNDYFERWCELKRGIKNNTFENYKYMYNNFAKAILGDRKLPDIKKSDIKKFYNYLMDDRCLKVATLDNVQNVLHQIFAMAVDDDLIRHNPTDNALSEFKRSRNLTATKKKGLTKAEQDLLLSYVKNNQTYKHWYPIIAVLIGTGLRIGELVGLRWRDVNFESGFIDVNHTIYYYQHRDPDNRRGCYFEVHTTKTEAGERKVPMFDFVKEAFMMEKEYQQLNGIECKFSCDGYTDFIFLNKDGNVHKASTLNKAFQRIIRDCNDEQFRKNSNPSVLLPHFSCHSFRHTFTTRMVEASVDVKALQETLGHKDISTTMNIYADATEEFQKKSFEGAETYFLEGSSPDNKKRAKIIRIV